MIYLCSTRPPHEAFYTFCAALVQVIITTYELILKDAAILNQVCAVARPHPPFGPPSLADRLVRPAGLPHKSNCLLEVHAAGWPGLLHSLL